MKNALKNWWNKPWTNGTYVKCCAGGTALAFIIMGIIYAIYLVVNAKKEEEMHEEMINLYGHGMENSDEVEEP